MEPHVPHRSLQPRAGPSVTTRRALRRRAADQEAEHGAQAAGPLPGNVDPATAPLEPAVLDRVQRLAGNRAAVALLVQREGEALGAGPAGGAAPGGGAAPAAAHPTLRRGDHGPAVVELQDKLGQALAAGGPVTTDGQFGRTTANRLRDFQRANGLTPDAVAGPLTWAALDTGIAGLPAPVRPELHLGDAGANVGLAQEKLNGSGQAGAVLAINGVFDAAMQTAVRNFQTARGLTTDGSVGATTWAALDTAAPGGGTRMEGGTAVEQNVNTSTPATSTANQIAGTSLHSPVGPGGITNGPAVKEFQLKLNVWLGSQGQPPIASDGGWGPQTQAATNTFQNGNGVPPTGIGDLPTWTALDVIAPVVSVGFENRQWEEEVGGHRYAMQEGGGGNGSRYSWEVTDREMKVTAAVRFVGHAAPASWFGHVRSTWNRFDLVEQTTGQRLPINFEMTRGSGGGANPVEVKTGTGRANAGEWFLGDTDAANTIPHEFGHLVGLRDEYQLHAGDYRTATGHEPFVGDAVGPAGQTPAAIATALQAAMVARSSVNARAATQGMAQGAFSQQVIAAYAALPTTTVPAVPGPPPLVAIPLTGNLVRDLDVALPDDSATSSAKYDTIEVLTYDSGSIMGDESRHGDPHDHGAQPRHLQEFSDVLGRLRGGTWVPQLR